MIKRLLIDLDVLLDTRLGTIARINPDAAVELVKTRNYWYRENDDWGKLTNGAVTNEAFKEAYAQRGGSNTADTINSSILSGIVPVVLKILAEDNVNRADNMGDPEDFVMLTINVAPYVLGGEYKLMLEEICAQLFGKSTNVEITTMPMEELSPLVLDSLFSAYITYDFIPWIKYHVEELGKVQMPCFNYISPRIFEHDVSKLSIDDKKNVLARFRMEKLVHMDFEFIDAACFSMFRKG